MSVEGSSLQILRAVGCHANQLTLLLHQFGSRLPNTDAELNQLITQIRRQEHIREGAPGNIATLLGGPLRQARPHAYYGQPPRQTDSYWTFDGDGPSATTPIAPWASPDMDTSPTYLENGTGEGRTTGAPADEYQDQEQWYDWNWQGFGAPC